MKTETHAPKSSDRLLQALATLAALLDRTINEVKILDEDFEKRLTQAVRETESSLQQKADSHLEEVVESVRKELKIERERLHRERDRTTQASLEWEAEKRILEAECVKARQAAVEARAAQEKAEKAQASGVSTETVRREIARIETKLKEISAVIDDPASELSTVIRKNVERAELESYLRGMRFAVDGK
jgi:hypothetical protein